jgi:hypothetical protein
VVEIEEQASSLIASKLEKVRVIHVSQKTVNVFSWNWNQLIFSIIATGVTVEVF